MNPESLAETRPLSPNPPFRRVNNRHLEGAEFYIFFKNIIVIATILSSALLHSHGSIHLRTQLPASLPLAEH
jgi:hypothetical protein